MNESEIVSEETQSVDAEPSASADVAAKKPRERYDFFHLRERKTSIKTELIAGLITFLAMVYILPVNAGILSATDGIGMDYSGVFAATALISALVTILMGMLANVPIALSAGMGMNAFLSYTVGNAMGFSWHESMILLTVSGIIFFIISVTKVRQWIIEKFPKDLKLIISAGLGAFICFVGLANGGIIQAGSGTLVGLGDLANPAVIIALVGVIIVIGLMFVKKKAISRMAIPITLLATAIIATIISTSMFNTGGVATLADLGGLPVAPWDAGSLQALDPKFTAQQWGISGLQNVLFFGVFASPEFQATQGFGQMLGNVFSNPATYIAIFSLTFVNLFDTTATMLAIGGKTGLIDEQGHMINGRRVIIADAVGSLVCAPLGTSTVTAFAESGVAVELGARTGLSAVITGLCFLVATFISPVFSFFSAGCVTAPALVAVGALIFAENFKEINWKDFAIPIIAFISVILMVLTYSLSHGLGIGLICYVVVMLFSGRYKELNPMLYIIAGLFLVSFILDPVLKQITQPTDSLQASFY